MVAPRLPLIIAIILIRSVGFFATLQLQQTDPELLAATEQSEPAAAKKGLSWESWRLSAVIPKWGQALAPWRVICSSWTLNPRLQWWAP